MIELEFICDACGTPIIGDDGVVQASFAEIREALALLRERGESSDRTLSVGDLMTLPPPVPWHILHLVCRPQDGDAYEIDVDQLRTLPDLDRWTRHLRPKTWFHLTDWEELFGGATANDGRRIVAKQPHGDAP